MRYSCALRYTCALLIMLLGPLIWAADKKGKKAGNTQAITGCLDEKPDSYVVRSEEMLKELAALEPVGFDKTLFARFVGHRVTVTGEMVTSTDPPTLRVKSYSSIKDIAEMCVPGEK